MCSLLEPLHAAAGLGIQHTYQWEDFQHIEFELATAYQGLDIARPRAHPGWRLGYSNLNWYTYINSAWMRKLGSHDQLLQALNDVRIGDWPALWKVGVDARPEHYVSVNETIKALRVMDLGAMHYGSVAGELRMNQFLSNAWLRRFDLPLGVARPTTPPQYRWVSPAEREQATSNTLMIFSPQFQASL